MHNLQCPYSKANMLQNNFKQECIPVGLVQPVSVGGGVSAWVCLPKGGVCLGVSAWVGGSSHGGVYPGVSTQGWCLTGRSLPKGCGCLPGWAGLPRGSSATPLPCGQTYAWENITLPQTVFAGGNDVVIKTLRKTMICILCSTSVLRVLMSQNNR